MMTPAVRVPVDTPQIGQISVGFEPCPTPNAVRLSCLSWGLQHTWPSWQQTVLNAAGMSPDHHC